MATKTLLTIKDLEALPDDGMRHELSEGELITMPHPKPKHGACLGNLAVPLGAFLQKHKLGRMYVGVGFKLGPRTVRVPDIAFVRRPPDDEDAYIEGGPDLAIEIVSPSNVAEDLRVKIRQYLDSGTSLVWVFYPKAREVEVYASGREIRILGIDDVLEAPDLLPGLQVTVSVLE